jgi:hypothetical protein
MFIHRKSNFRSDVNSRALQSKAILLLTAILLLLPLARFAHAEDPIQPDRPDFTNGTSIIPLGKLQFEGGYTYTHQRGLSVGTLGEGLLRIPRSERFELRVGVPTMVQTRENQTRTTTYEGTELGFKWKIAEGNPDAGLKKPGVAVLGATTLPIAVSAEGRKHLLPSVSLLLDAELSKRLEIGANFGMGNEQDENGVYHQMFGSAVAEYALQERLHGYVEYYRFFASSNHLPDTPFLNAGLSYLTSKNDAVDLRIGRQLNGLSQNIFIGSGISHRW